LPSTSKVREGWKAKSQNIKIKKSHSFITDIVGYRMAALPKLSEFFQ
jgi:hypothetical protein